MGEGGVVDYLGYMVIGKICRGYEGNCARGPLRVEGWNDESGGGKGTKILETKNQRAPINESKSCKIRIQRRMHTKDS